MPMAGLIINLEFFLILGYNFPSGMRKFTIKPNNSLSQRELILLGSAFTLVLVLLAARLLMLGFWLVVPFLLLDFLVVAAAFYLIRRKTRIHESIYVDDAELQIHHHET